MALNLDKKETKYCKHCGEKILKQAIICVKCGLQVEELKVSDKVIIKNGYGNAYRAKNKWIALGLCVFLGFLGIHKFYEGKNSLGVLYLFTGGLFGIGYLIDIVNILFKSNPYYI